MTFTGIEPTDKGGLIWHLECEHCTYKTIVMKDNDISKIKCSKCGKTSKEGRKPV